jgi:hypothetical protein
MEMNTSKKSDLIKESFLGAFSQMVDYRRENSTVHGLLDIIFLVICAFISGCNDLKSAALYIKVKKEWFSSFLDLKSGVPSYTTIWMVMHHLDPKALNECFTEWVNSIAVLSKGRVIPIDGKAHRGTAITGESNSFIHTVCAWCSENQMVLGQKKVDAKSNESDGNSNKNSLFN